MSSTRLDGRIQLVILAVLLLFGLLGARLWQLQIIMGETYSLLSSGNRLRTEKIPSPRGIIYDRNGRPLVKNSAYFFVALHPEAAKSADLRDIAEFLGMAPRSVADIVSAVKDPIEPIRIKGGLKPDEVAFIEARISDYPGLVIEAEETRHYLYGPVGAHLIGYLGKLNPQQASRKDYKGVPRKAFTGQWGVERMYDAHLRGEPGRRVIEVDALGRRLRILSETPPTNGEDLHLSIDMDMQLAAEEAFDKKVGSLVAISPGTGEVLAMVSRPSFDPNLFSRGISYDHWVRLRENKGFPMLNRALQSHYPPGSTYKLITAMAALDEEDARPDDKHLCTGAVNKGRWSFRCWRRGGHGVMDMQQAIIQSCDVYFYLTGERTGIDNIAKYARKFGLGSETGLGLIKEKSGLVPDKAWKESARGEPWYLGETFNAAIGQGFVLTTPIQLAQMTATLANGGYRYALRLTRADEQPEYTKDLHLDFEHVDFIKNALRGVVINVKGTGRAANSRHVRVAGKTGTAQVISQKTVRESEIPDHLKDHAWFVAFAPVNEPQVAVAVFVENGGHGGAAAAPIARKAIEALLAKDKVQKPAGGRMFADPSRPAPTPAPTSPQRSRPKAWTDLLNRSRSIVASPQEPGAAQEKKKPPVKVKPVSITSPETGPAPEGMDLPKTVSEEPKEPGTGPAVLPGATPVELQMPESPQEEPIMPAEEPVIKKPSTAPIVNKVEMPAPEVIDMPEPISPVKLNKPEASQEEPKDPATETTPETIVPEELKKPEAAESPLKEQAPEARDADMPKKEEDSQ